MKHFFLSILIALFSSFAFSQELSQNRPIISDLNAISQESDSIKLTWNFSKEATLSVKNFIILRDTKQISSYAQLDKLKPIATINFDTTFNSTEFVYIDNVPDSKEYFYAILCNTENGIYKVIFPSINTTIIGAKAKITSTQTDSKKVQSKKIKSEKSDSIKVEKTKREIPLPALNLLNDKNAPKSNSTLKTSTDKSQISKDQNLLGKKALAIGEELGKNYFDTKNKIAKVHIFEEDFISPEGGDAYFLFKILKENFVKKDYNSSIEKLTDFLSVHRDQEITNRAIFYLGESYYFTNNFEQAVFNFLQLKEVFPELSKKWIDSSLDLLEISE